MRPHPRSAAEERRRGAPESTARQESSRDPIPASKAARRGCDMGFVLAHNLEQLLQPGGGGGHILSPRFVLLFSGISKAHLSSRVIRARMFVASQADCPFHS